MHVHYTWIHTKEYTFLPDFSAPCLNHRTRKQSNCYPTNISRFVLIPYFGSQLFSTIQGLVEGSLKIFRLKMVHDSPWQHEKKASMDLVVSQEGSKPRREAGRHHWWGIHQLPVVTTSFSHCRFWASSKLCHNMVIYPPNKFNQLVFSFLLSHLSPLPIMILHLFHNASVPRLTLKNNIYVDYQVMNLLSNEVTSDRN